MSPGALPGSGRRKLDINPLIRHLDCVEKIAKFRRSVRTSGYRTRMPSYGGRNCAAPVVQQIVKLQGIVFSSGGSQGFIK